MWTFKQTQITAGKVSHYTILKNRNSITAGDFIDGLGHSQEFRTFYNAILAQSPYPAFFWEHPPFQKNNLNAAYEFVLVSSPFLNLVNSDPSAFVEHFTSGQDIVSFGNLGGDAQLITPCPKDNLNKYAHLGLFAREASASQVDSFWKNVGREFSNQLCNEPKWLNTSGLGVYWLHVRIDSVPKYYQFHPYKK
jgi:hypothetical protein